MALSAHSLAVRAEDYLQAFARPFMKGQVSRRFITQDFFRSSAGVEYVGQKLRISGEVSGRRIAFVQSDYLEEFLKLFDPSWGVETLLVGRSDRDFHEPFELPEGVKRAFLQNLCFQKEAFSLLPIGVENLELAKNGLPHNIRRTSQKKNKVLVGPFGDTHEDRRQLNQIVKSPHSGLTHLTARMTAFRYSRVASQHAYVACPRGNGQDTHRFWETLYRGSIPIVKRSEWSWQIKQLGIEIIELDNWEQILDIDLQAFKPATTPNELLELNYWRMRIGV